MPDLPTVGETLTGYAVDSWYGLVVPVNTPTSVIAFLNRQTNAVLAMPEVIDAMARNGVGAERSTPEGFGQLMRDGAARWEKLIREANIELN